MKKIIEVKYDSENGISASYDNFDRGIHRYASRRSKEDSKHVKELEELAETIIMYNFFNKFELEEDEQED